MVLPLPAAGFGCWLWGGALPTMGWGGKGKGPSMGTFSQLWHLCSGQSAAEWDATQALFHQVSSGKGKSKGQDAHGRRGKGNYVQSAAWPTPEAPEDGGWTRVSKMKQVVMGPNGKPDTMTHPVTGEIVVTAYLCHVCSHKHCSHNRAKCANHLCGAKRDRSKEPLSVTKKGNPFTSPLGLGTKGGRVNPTEVSPRTKPKGTPQRRRVSMAESTAAMDIDEGDSDDADESEPAHAYTPPTLLKPGNVRTCVDVKSRWLSPSTKTIAMATSVAQSLHSKELHNLHC